MYLRLLLPLKLFRTLSSAANAEAENYFRQRLTVHLGRRKRKKANALQTIPSGQDPQAVLLEDSFRRPETSDFPQGSDQVHIRYNEGLSGRRVVSSKLLREQDHGPATLLSDSQTSVNALLSHQSLPSETQPTYDYPSPPGRKTLQLHTTDEINPVPDFDRIVDLSSDKMLSPIDDENLDRAIKHYIASELRPYSRPLAFNVAYFVNDSPVLSSLVDFGVHLHNWSRSTVEKIVHLDFAIDFAPSIAYLRQSLKLTDCEIARIISNNPKIFIGDSIDQISHHVKYLLRKKFTMDQLPQLFREAPKWLGLTVEEVDGRLGKLQQSFFLSGNEIRKVCLLEPCIVTSSIQKVLNNQFILTRMLGFSGSQSKRILTSCPRTYLSGREIMEINFDFLFNEMKLSHEEIMIRPEMLRKSPALLWPRLQYLIDKLKMRGNLGAVLKQTLLSPSDEEFCREANVSFDEYLLFLKSR